MLCNGLKPLTRSRGKQVRGKDRVAGIPQVRENVPRREGATWGAAQQVGGGGWIGRNKGKSVWVGEE